MPLLENFKSCVFCGSMFVLTPGFCRYCSLEIEKRTYAPKVIIVKGMIVRPLFLWSELHNLWVKHLAYSLKGGGCMPEQNFLAHLFLSIKNFKLKNADFYCAPGRHGDHAHEWAAAITSAVGKDFRRPFIKKSIKQKTKTKAEREMINIEISERPIKTKNANKAIFLDDIVATGSTAHNSLSLLEGYVFNEVWCIAYKEHCSD